MEIEIVSYEHFRTVKSTERIYIGIFAGPMVAGKNTRPRGILNLYPYYHNRMPTFHARPDFFLLGLDNKYSIVYIYISLTEYF